jgi:4-hydroxy-tetrahydrodipicolinate synthase
MKCGELGLYAQCKKALGDKIVIGCPVDRFMPLLITEMGMQYMGAGCYEVMQSTKDRYVVECFNLLVAGKFDQAMEIYWKLAPARNMFEARHMPTVLSGLYDFNLQKYYQFCTGGNGGQVRQPALKVHQHDLEQVKMAYFLIGVEPEGPDNDFYLGRSQSKANRM